MATDDDEEWTAPGDSAESPWERMLMALERDDDAGPSAAGTDALRITVRRRTALGAPALSRRR